MTNVTAVFENGVFRPTGPVELADGQKVQLTIHPPTTMDEWRARLKATTTYKEWMELANSCPDPGPDYDMDAMLEATRRWYSQSATTAESKE